MPQEVGFEAIRPALEREKQDPSPLVRWMASCIEEIYFGGDMSLARIKGPFDPDLKYVPRAVRIMALLGPEVYGVTVSILPESDEEALHYAGRLREWVGQLQEPHIAAAVALMEFAQQVVRAQGKQVLGALEIALTRKRKELVHVIYPKSYVRATREAMASLGMGLSEHQARESSFGIAMVFLKRSQFTADKPHILRRENTK